VKNQELRTDFNRFIKGITCSKFFTPHDLCATFLVALFCISPLAYGQPPSTSTLKPNELVVVPMGAVKVEVLESKGRYQLFRGGVAYMVKGAGLVDADLASFVSHGGNSIRTWSTENAQQVLDDAYEHGVTVSLCLWVQHERHGFDYDDDFAIAQQLREFKEEVLKYRNHPALLMWIIGNEVNNEHFDNTKVFRAIDEISKLIHQLDPNHPTTTALAGYNNSVLFEIESSSPDLDFVSFQMYGDLINLPRYIEDAGYRKPFFVTEWGAIGHWEVNKTSWGAPIEQNSSAKARNYLRGNEKVLKLLGDQVLGSYVFVWGQKQERTPTWYGMFTSSGEETEVVDVMHHIWTGKLPSNQSPAVDKLVLDDQISEDSVHLSANKVYEAKLYVYDPDDDPLSFAWEIKKESEAASGGGDFEADMETIENLIKGGQGPRVIITAPAIEGAYRLYAYAYDQNDNVAHANIPFYVKNK
jgi:hypothetical protein